MPSHDDGWEFSDVDKLAIDWMTGFTDAAVVLGLLSSKCRCVSPAADCECFVSPLKCTYVCCLQTALV